MARIAELGRQLWDDLRRTSIKQPGDQERTWQQIEALERLATTSDPEGRTAYHYSWMKGRWHVLSGQYPEALPHYKKAFEQACYRAGTKSRTSFPKFHARRPFCRRKGSSRTARNRGHRLWALPQA